MPSTVSLSSTFASGWVWRSGVGATQILDRDRLDLIRGDKPKDPGVEVELGLQRASDGCDPAEAVLLALKGDVGDGNALRPQGLHYHLRLIRRYNPVLQSLEEDDRDFDPIRKLKWRAGPVQVRPFRVWADQGVVVLRLELVSVVVHRHQIAHAVI